MRGLTRGMIWLVAGAIAGVSAPAAANASLGTGARVDGADHSARALQLAAKKKKKKKAGGGKKSGGATGGSDDSESDSSGGSEEAAAPSSGGGDEEVQRAARVAPKDDSSGSGSGGGSESGDGDRPSSRSKKSAMTIEREGSAGPASEGSPQRFLDLAVGGNGFARSLTYNQLIAGNLREYQPRALGGLVVGLLYYPGAQFSSGFVSNLGLEANVAQAFGISSKTPDGASYATAIHDYNGGLHVRLPLDAVTPMLAVGFGDSAYSFSGANRAALTLPDVHYQYVRAALGVQVPLPGGLSFSISGGYRHVLSVGQIKDTYFKNLTVAGAEADAYLAYGVMSNVEARLGLALRRYFYSMHSKSGEIPLAGGAVDQTIGGSLSVAVLLGGTDQPRSSSSSSSEEAPSSAGDADSDLKAKPKKKRKADPNGME